MTAHIVRTMDEAIRMLPQVLALDHRTVRQRFEQRFSAARMAKDYVHVYAPCSAVVAHGARGCHVEARA